MAKLKAITQWVAIHKTFILFLGFLGYAIYQGAMLPFGHIPQLQHNNPHSTAFIELRQNENKRLMIDRQWIPLSRIPSHVVTAILIAEDDRFFLHNGIDLYEIWESIKFNFAEMRFGRGGSTISQQLAKNLYLSPSKTPIRKVKEIILAFVLEKHLSKKRILELYLNYSEWGNGIFGIEAASRKYFGKSTRRLTPKEAARLAAVLPNPLRYQPDRDSGYVMRRTHIVLQRMATRGTAAYQ